MLLPLNGRKIPCSGSRLSPQLAFVWCNKMKMSLLKKIFLIFFRETPTSPWFPFRVKFRPLGWLFCPSRTLAYSLPCSVFHRACGHWNWTLYFFFLINDWYLSILTLVKECLTYREYNLFILEKKVYLIDYNVVLIK